MLHQVEMLPHKWPRSLSCCLHLPNQGIPASLSLSLSPLHAKSHKICPFQMYPKIQLAKASADSRSVVAYVPSVVEDSPWHRPRSGKPPKNWNILWNYVTWQHNLATLLHAAKQCLKLEGLQTLWRMLTHCYQSTNHKWWICIVSTVHVMYFMK